MLSGASGFVSPKSCLVELQTMDTTWKSYSEGFVPSVCDVSPYLPLCKLEILLIYEVLWAVINTCDDQNEMQLLKCFATNDITKPSHPFTPYDSTTTQVCGSDCSLLAGHSNSPKRPCHMKCCHAKVKSNEGWPSQPHRKAGSIVPRT